MSRPALLLLALAVFGGCQSRSSKPEGGAVETTDKGKGETAAQSSARTDEPTEVYTLPGMEAERPRTAPSAGTPSDEAWTASPADAPAASGGNVASGAREAVDRYLALSDANDLGPILDQYADRVSYYAQGTVGRDAIRDDKARYTRRWPVRQFRPTSAPALVATGEGRVQARLDYAYDVSDPASGRQRSGEAWTELLLERRSGGWKIVAERGGTRPADGTGTPSPATASGSEDRSGVEAAIDAYLAVSAQNDVEAVLDLYAPQVRYYALGTVGRSRLRQDKDAYFERWPDRTFALEAAPRIAFSDGGRTATVRLSYGFEVYGGTRRRSGRAWTDLTYRRDAAGAWKIVAENGGTR